mgnify:FL=1
MEEYRSNMNILKEVLRGKRPHDDVEFVAWLKESEEHQKCYEEALQQAASDLRIKKSFNRQLIWNRVLDETRKKERVRVLRRSFMRYAAVLLPFVALFAWWLLKTGDVESSVEVTTNEDGIMLFLSNGERVNISQFDSTGVLEKNGMKIRMTEKRDQIVYENHDDISKELIYNTLSVPARAEYCLTLEDGTKVWLAATSRLKYPVNFVGTSREVYLEGEAFFDVARDTSKPFIVNCATFSVKALGTSFDVSCYNDDEFGLATLASGKIEVALGDQKKILSPGEQALIKEQSLSVKEVNILPYTSWMEDRLYFFNEKLESIMKRMARWYGIEVCYADLGIRELHFTGNVPKYTDIEKVFDILEFATHLDFSLEKGKVLISRSKK